MILLKIHQLHLFLFSSISGQLHSSPGFVSLQGRAFPSGCRSQPSPGGKTCPWPPPHGWNGDSGHFRRPIFPGRCDFRLNRNAPPGAGKSRSSSWQPEKSLPPALGHSPRQYFPSILRAAFPPKRTFPSFVLSLTSLKIRLSPPCSILMLSPFHCPFLSR